MRIGLRQRLLLATALFVAGTTAAFAAGQTYQFDIPAESLSRALTDYSQVSSQQIFFTEVVVKDRKSGGLHGRYDAVEALHMLLAGTDLTVQANSVGVLTVQPKNAEAASDEEAANLGGIETVIVTAEKRAQNIQDVPVSVNVLTGAQLTAMHAVSLQDMAGYIPGLIIQPGGAAGFETVVLDGIAPTGTTTSARVYIDEVPMGSSSGFVNASTITPDLMPYDIDRVEVLGGPQGTLYGANAMSGLIKYVLVEPDPSQFTAEAGADLFGIQGGGGAGEQLRAAVNAPLIDGELAVRASFYQRFTPGYVNDVQTGWKDDNAVHQQGGRIAVLWEPLSTFSIKATALYQDTLQVNNDTVEYNYSTHRPFAGGGIFSNIYYLPQTSDIGLQLYDLTAKWDLGWASLTSATSYQVFRTSYTDDVSEALQPLVALIFGVPNVDAYAYANPEVKKFTQELRLASPSGGTFEWMVGGYFTHETTTEPQSVVALSGIGQLEFSKLLSTYKEVAVFANGTWHITDRLDVGVGGRYSYNDQHYLQPLGGLLEGEPPNVPAIVDNTYSNQGVATWDVNPSYHFDANNMVYVRIATGYQPGGPNAVPPDVVGAPTSYRSSTLIDYEAGVKSIFLDGKALADLSVYDIDWTAIQVPVFYPACGCDTIGNGGTARSVGASLGTSYSPVDGLLLGANLAYTDAVTTAPIPSLNTLTGARLPDVPLWAFSLTGDYSVPINERWKFDAGVGYRYGGRSWDSVEGTTEGGIPEAFFEPGYGEVDLHAGISDGSWKVVLYGKNITNDLYLRNEEPLPFYAFSGVVSQPRTIGISIDKSF